MTAKQFICHPMFEAAFCILGGIASMYAPDPSPWFGWLAIGYGIGMAMQYSRPVR